MESYVSLLKKLGVSYIGSCKQSVKLLKSYKNGIMTYGIYLAPADMSGYNVCPNSATCKANCLNASGQNKVALLAHKSHINNARIKKTIAFFEQKDLFMQTTIKEITRYQNYAKKHNMGFAVRLNCTSDISIEDFIYEGKNLLEIFPNVQFYDYTKVPQRFNLVNKYKNFDITFSFNGYNWMVCEKYLRLNGRVAVVFDGDMPKTYKGYKVVNGDNYDFRFLDEKGVVIGLTYHKVASDYVNGKYVRPNSKFIVRTENNADCEF